MNTVYFRSRWTFDDYGFQMKGANTVRLTINRHGKNSVSIRTLRQPTPEEHRAAAREELKTPFITSLLLIKHECAVDDGIYAEMQSLLAHEELSTQYDWMDHLDEEKDSSEIEISNELRRLYTDLVGLFGSLANDIVETMFWMGGDSGSHDPFPQRGFTKWSLDKRSWWHIPSRGNSRIHLVNKSGIFHIEQDFLDELTRNVEDCSERTISHNIYREANNQRVERPTSAIVVSITALENSVKSYVANTVPNSEWLIENIPSPPVVNIMRHYIPKIYESRHNRSIMMPSSLLNRLGEVIKNRNKVVHGLPFWRLRKSVFDLDSFLQDVKDALYLLDYLSGYEWAYDHLSDKTKDEFKRIV